MAKFKITGQAPLKGEIEVVGCKNAALPLICASLLTSETCRIKGVPRISDIKILLDMIEKLGANVKRKKEEVIINGGDLKPQTLEPSDFIKLRASILLLGPFLGRFGKAKLGYPGGCIIGRRPIDTHLEAVEGLGGEVKEGEKYFKTSLEQNENKTLYLKEASVTATENVLMMAASVDKTTKIEFAACEPHITNLCQMLEKMGAKIKGIGSNVLIVKGASKLSGAEIEVMPDNMEAGTFIALGAASKAPLTIKNINPDHLHPVFSQMKRMNINYKVDKDRIKLKPPFDLKPVKIHSQPWPGFPTDLQPPFTVLATQIEGTTLVHEPMYEGRLYWVDDLTKMGANIIPCDPHRVVVNGRSKLRGGKIISPDIRAGIALVIAALIAEGKSQIDNIELIDRGYQKIEERLKGIGAKIKRVT